MRILLLLFLAGVCTDCLAQESEFTDFRSKRENFTRLYDKLIRSEMASFAIGGIEESLGKAPLKKLPAVKYGNDFISFDSNDVHITIRSMPFNPGKHKLGYEGKYLTRIDNRPYYGNYSKVPATAIAAITIVVGKDTVAVPASVFADLYNPEFTFTDATGTLSTQSAVYLSADKRRMYIYMLNRDNSGGYEVTWIIQDNAYLRRVLDFGFTQ